MSFIVFIQCRADVKLRLNYRGSQSGFNGMDRTCQAILQLPMLACIICQVILKHASEMLALGLETLT